jgi:hypothetical protein
LAEDKLEESEDEDVVVLVVAADEEDKEEVEEDKEAEGANADKEEDEETSVLRTEEEVTLVAHCRRTFSWQLRTHKVMRKQDDGLRIEKGTNLLTHTNDVVKNRWVVQRAVIFGKLLNHIAVRFELELLERLLHGKERGHLRRRAKRG